jgi:hypothetical protein
MVRLVTGQDGIIKDILLLIIENHLNMKSKIFKYIPFFLASFLIFSACQKTDIQQANDDFDFNKIVPKVQGIMGPMAVSQTFTETYSANYFRGGSTWNWSVTGATIASVSEDTHEVDVTFTTTGKAVVTVTETTMGGITSEPYSSDSIAVAAFCPLTRDDFLGTWTGDETGDGAGPITVTVIAGAGADEIVLEADAEAYPQLLSNIFKGWGETFQPGFGPEGDITLIVNNNGTISVGLDYWGQTLPGPYDYWYLGSGTWSGCGGITMSLHFGLDWDETGTEQYASDVDLTKQ